MTYLPDIYKNFKTQFKDVGKALDELSVKCNNWGPLDDRAKRFVKLGIAIGLTSEGGVRSHARRALAEGITPDEIRHAVILATTTAGFPEMIAAMKWVEEVIENREK
jgi:4-carboxymuconolactone decarboxylase